MNYGCFISHNLKIRVLRLLAAHLASPSPGCFSCCVISLAQSGFGGLNWDPWASLDRFINLANWLLTMCDWTPLRQHQWTPKPGWPSWCGHLWTAQVWVSSLGVSSYTWAMGPTCERLWGLTELQGKYSEWCGFDGLFLFFHDFFLKCSAVSWHFHNAFFWCTEF